jgi:hypothetical protein
MLITSLPANVVPYDINCAELPLSLVKALASYQGPPFPPPNYWMRGHGYGTNEDFWIRGSWVRG